MSELKPVNIAILALGGEGGDVLAAWLADAAERGGYLVQTTSESGIAERTGAAMYYLELFPKALAAARGKAPVLGLTPMPGHVDIVVATELMEAGRAIERGLVTPDRTALIASTHRVYTMAEKTAQSDSRADPKALLAACRSAAARFAGFDMAAAAEKAKCHVHAVLLGAVAASGALPIPPALFEEAIREGGTNTAPASLGLPWVFPARKRTHPPRRKHPRRPNRNCLPRFWRNWSAVPAATRNRLSWPGLSGPPITRTSIMPPSTGSDCFPSLLWRAPGAATNASCSPWPHASSPWQ